MCSSLEEAQLQRHRHPVGFRQPNLTGLAAHTEQVGQQRYNEDTAHNPQGHKGMELGRREFQGRGVSVALRALLGAVLSTRDFRSLVT